MSNDEGKLYNEDGAVAEAGADGVPAGLDARGVGIRMAHATLSYVSLSSIEPNPFRDLNTYPYDKRKLEALERSIEHVGLWEGLIGRRAGHGYQLAFGHHRLEAARSRKLTTTADYPRPHRRGNGWVHGPGEYGGFQFGFSGHVGVVGSGAEISNLDRD
jgi:hypothetical protein